MHPRPVRRDAPRRLWREELSGEKGTAVQERTRHSRVGEPALRKRCREKNRPRPVGISELEKVGAVLRWGQSNLKNRAVCRTYQDVFAYRVYNNVLRASAQDVRVRYSILGARVDEQCRDKKRDHEPQSRRQSQSGRRTIKRAGIERLRIKKRSRFLHQHV